VTVTLWAPGVAPTVETLRVIWVDVVKVTLLTVTPPVTEALM
jgi:hypothetical protein